MAEVKLTKNELRFQQNRLTQLKKYLPTLQLKKAMLQLEVQDAKIEMAQAQENYDNLYEKVKAFASLLTIRNSINFDKETEVVDVKRRFENIAGVEVPYFESIEFKPISYNLIDTAPWVDGVILKVRGLKEALVRIDIAEEKKVALEKELREVSIRVNLFEKILIPRAESFIKKIKVFLGDLALSAVSQAKVAKAIILEKKQVGK